MLYPLRGMYASEKMKRPRRGGGGAAFIVC
jgi:hypothetical protein